MTTEWSIAVHGGMTLTLCWYWELRFSISDFKDAFSSRSSFFSCISCEYKIKWINKLHTRLILKKNWINKRTLLHVTLQKVIYALFSVYQLQMLCPLALGLSLWWWLPCHSVVYQDLHHVQRTWISQLRNNYHFKFSNTCLIYTFACL